MYPWNDEPAYRTCYLTDATWDLGDLKGMVDVDSLPMDKGPVRDRPRRRRSLDHLDLYLDFIPLVHVPNTVPPAEEHWGQSSLAKALQVFDELAGTDTDSSKASATTGSPMIFLSGKSTGRQTQQVGPGVMVELGENGRADALNTAPQLQELRAHRHDLLDQAANVVRLPAVSLGTMDPSKVPSGYALELSLGPLDSLVAHMRLARGHKYALLLRFVQRLHLAGQHPDWAGLPPLPARLEWGPYTPTDKAAVLDQVATAYDKHLISLETAVRMLTAAGWPIDDAETEIELIESRAFEQARMLADALGSPEEVAAFLHRDPPAEPEAPAVQLPSLPAAGANQLAARNEPSSARCTTGGPSTSAKPATCAPSVPAAATPSARSHRSRTRHAPARNSASGRTPAHGAHADPGCSGSRRKRLTAGRECRRGGRRGRV